MNRTDCLPRDEFARVLFQVSHPSQVVFKGNKRKPTVFFELKASGSLDLKSDSELGGFCKGFHKGSGAAVHFDRKATLDGKGRVARSLFMRECCLGGPQRREPCQGAHRGHLFGGTSEISSGGIDTSGKAV